MSGAAPYTAAVTLADLLDRAAIADLLNGYAYGIDRRDWPLYRSIFADPLEVDLAWSGVRTAMAADAWVATVAQTLAPFDATEHRMTNVAVALNGDRGTLTCQMTARHMLEVDGRHQIHFLAGRYEHEVVRTREGWRIATLRLVITMEEGDRGLFDQAAALGVRPRADVGETGMEWIRPA